MSETPIPQPDAEPAPAQEPVREQSASSREDEGLIREALTGNEKAYKRLAEKYNRALYFHLVKIVRERELVEDLVMEILSKAFTNLANYNNQYAFSTWLYRIATNHAIDHLRKKKLRTYSIDEPISTKDGEMQVELPDTNFMADTLIMESQRNKVVHEAMDSLPEKYRLVIEMRHMEEKSYQEIAEILKLPLGTVKAHIFRARELLYKYLKDKQGLF
jgi:RNA polymerase sigma-70 factor (ECF subfamily)